MQIQLWEGLTGTDSRIQVGERRRFVVPLSRIRVLRKTAKGQKACTFNSWTEKGSWTMSSF